MSDLKEFWINVWEERTKASFDEDYDRAFENGYQRAWNDVKKKQGLFFWERGGKQFVEEELQLHKNGYRDNSKDFFETITRIANTTIEFEYTTCLIARDFLDCVACLGEQKVKKLIKELEGKE